MSDEGAADGGEGQVEGEDHVRTASGDETQDENDKPLGSASSTA